MDDDAVYEIVDTDNPLDSHYVLSNDVAVLLIRCGEFIFFSRDLEDRFAMVMRSYEEFEVHLVTVLERFCINREMNPECFPIFNQKLLNLLSNIRMYHDHRDRSLKDLFDRNVIDIREDVKRIFSHQYDGSFSYRLVEELRNVVQHRLLPVRAFRMIMTNMGSFENPIIKCSLDPCIEAESILKDKALKQKIRDEIQISGEQHFFIKSVIREYIDLLVVCHNQIRDTTENLFQRCSAEITQTNVMIADNAKRSLKKLNLKIVERKLPNNYMTTINFHLAEEQAEKRKAFRFAPPISKVFFTSE